jgi:heme/copper-type cytochrome/quinol oxidase subunit 4
MKLDLSLLRTLKADGKLHKRLLVQIRILSIISVILLGVVAYNVVVYGLSAWLALAIAAVSFLLGLFVFSRMNTIVWNEEEEIIKTGRMEILGFVVLALYVGFEIGLRTLLNAEFPHSFAATAYLFAGIGASLLGRSLGTLIAIQKLDRKQGISS